MYPEFFAVLLLDTHQGTAIWPPYQPFNFEHCDAYTKHIDLPQFGQVFKGAHRDTRDLAELQLNRTVNTPREVIHWKDTPRTNTKREIRMFTHMDVCTDVQFTHEQFPNRESLHRHTRTKINIKTSIQSYALNVYGQLSHNLANTHTVQQNSRESEWRALTSILAGLRRCEAQAYLSRTDPKKSACRDRPREVSWCHTQARQIQVTVCTRKEDADFLTILCYFYKCEHTLHPKVIYTQMRIRVFRSCVTKT